MPAAVFGAVFVIAVTGLFLLFGNDRSTISAIGSRGAGLLAVALALGIAAAVTAAFTHRRRIARAADDAAVATLAAGVKAKRKIGEKASSYRQRIIDRADGA